MKQAETQSTIAMKWIDATSSYSAGTAGYGTDEGCRSHQPDDVFAKLEKILASVKIRRPTGAPVRSEAPAALRRVHK